MSIKLISPIIITHIQIQYYMHMNKKSEDVGSDLAPRNRASYNVRKKKEGVVRFAIRWNRFWTAPFFCDLEYSGQVKNTDQFLLYVSLTAVGEEVVAFERILQRKLLLLSRFV